MEQKLGLVLCQLQLLVFVFFLFWTKINFKKNNFLAKHSTFLDLQSNCWNKKRTVFWVRRVFFAEIPKVWNFLQSWWDSSSFYLKHFPSATVSSAHWIFVFFTQFDLIEHVLPQAAQPGIHFYCFHNTQLQMLHLEGPDYGHSTGERK